MLQSPEEVIIYLLVGEVKQRIALRIFAVNVEIFSVGLNTSWPIQNLYAQNHIHIHIHAQIHNLQQVATGSLAPYGLLHLCEWCRLPEIQLQWWRTAKFMWLTAKKLVHGFFYRSKRFHQICMLKLILIIKLIWWIMVKLHGLLVSVSLELLR